MDSSITNQIDAAFQEGKEEGMVHLYNTFIKDAGFQYLITKETHKVTDLNLHWNQLSPLSMRRMREMKWDSLTQLWLDNNLIGDSGCKYLSIVSIPQILHIGLNVNLISSLGVTYLSKAQWQAIQSIWLDQNIIGVRGVKEISKANWLSTIEHISLWENQLSVDQVQKLVLCDMPKIKLIHVHHNTAEKWSKDNVKSTLRLKFVSAGSFIYV